MHASSLQLIMLAAIYAPDMPQKLRLERMSRSKLPGAGKPQPDARTYLKDQRASRRKWLALTGNAIQHTELFVLKK